MFSHKVFRARHQRPFGQTWRALGESEPVVRQAHNTPELAFGPFQGDHVLFCLIISLGKKILCSFAYPQCNPKEPDLTVFKGFSFLKFILLQTYRGICPRHLIYNQRRSVNNLIRNVQNRLFCLLDRWEPCFLLLLKIWVRKMTSVTFVLNQPHSFCNRYPHNDFTENPRTARGTSPLTVLRNMKGFFHLNNHNHSIQQLCSSFQFSEVLSWTLSLMWTNETEWKRRWR